MIYFCALSGAALCFFEKIWYFSKKWCILMKSQRSSEESHCFSYVLVRTHWRERVSIHHDMSIYEIEPLILSFLLIVILARREEDTPMSKNWMTTTEAATIISKNSHHSVSPHHVRTLVSRGKISARSFSGGTTLLKRSDVEATRVAVGTGNNHRRDREVTT